MWLEKHAKQMFDSSQVSTTIQKTYLYLKCRRSIFIRMFLFLLAERIYKFRQINLRLKYYVGVLQSKVSETAYIN
jgi:hypothetical protein